MLTVHFVKTILKIFYIFSGNAKRFQHFWYPFIIILLLDGISFPQYRTGRTSFLVLKQRIYTHLYVKYYIWVTRCRKVNLDINGFLSWFKFELKINHMSYLNDPRFNYLKDNNYRMDLLLDL